MDHPGSVRPAGRRLHDPYRPGRRHHRQRGDDQAERRSGQLRNQTNVRRLAVVERPVNGKWSGWSRPQGFVAGRLSNLSPEQSSLNKQLYGVIGSAEVRARPVSGQSTHVFRGRTCGAVRRGDRRDANPQPAGAFWGVRGGHNCSSNPAINGDNYTRMTNYIAATLAAGMGIYVGEVINADLFRRDQGDAAYLPAATCSARACCGSPPDGSLPFSVICDSTNNPESRTALGYVQSDAQVRTRRSTRSSSSIWRAGRPSVWCSNRRSAPNG